MSVGSRRAKGFSGTEKSAYTNGPNSLKSMHSSGRGAAWLARYTGGVEVAGSNPVAPTFWEGRFLPACFVSDCLIR